MPVTIESYEQPWRFTPWLHKMFGAIYVLLAIRFAFELHDGPREPFVFRPTSLGAQLLRRSSGILIQPFYFVFFPLSFHHNQGIYFAMILAACVYAFIHHGMTMRVNNERSASMADRILKICKAMFFMMGTLLLLLIVLRMGVMLYQDLTFERTVIAVPAQKQQ